VRLDVNDRRAGCLAQVLKNLAKPTQEIVACLFAPEVSLNVRLQHIAKRLQFIKQTFSCLQFTCGQGLDNVDCAKSRTRGLSRTWFARRLLRVGHQLGCVLVVAAHVRR